SVVAGSVGGSARRRAATHGRIGGRPAHFGQDRASAPLRKFNLLLAVHRRDQEPQPALVRNGELRKCREGAPPPREGAQRRALKNQAERLRRITHRRARAAAPSVPCTVLRIWIAF